MAKLSFALIFILALASCLFADYADNIAFGDMAYGNWDLKDALRYYQAAYGENPNADLLKKINSIQHDLSMAAASARDYAAKTPDNPWKWVLMGADVLGAAGSVYTIIDYNRAVSTWNNDPYNFGPSVNVYLKGVYMYVTLSVAGSLIIYTLADVLWLHYLFPANVDAAYIPGRNELKLTYNYAF